MEQRWHLPKQSTASTHTDTNNPPSTTGRSWKPRRQGACTMCKLKKIRCDGATPCLYCKRHDEECIYQQSRKRQSSKKSSGGSVSSKNPPDYQLPLDDAGISTTNVMIDQSNGTNCWPVSSHSSTVNLSSLENGSSGNLQGLDPLSESQNFARTLPELTTCGLPRDVGGVPSVHSVPPSTGKSSLDEPTGSLWPMFTIDPDWQLDFDAQLTTEHDGSIVGATPIAMTELDLSQAYNPASQGFDSQSLSKGLVEYLTLGKKASSTKSFPDPIPNIDYSLTAMFSLQDRELGHISSSQRDKVIRVFKRLSEIKAPPSESDLASEQCQNGFASWYRNNETLMESCKAACFRLPTGISSFLTMPYIDNVIREAVDETCEESKSMSISLIDSVMAYGYQACLTVSQRSISAEERSRAHQHAKIPLRRRGSVLRAPMSLLKLQTILAMATISEHIDEIIYCELIAGAVSCARALKLDYRDVMHELNTSNKDKDLARRSFWYLYSIEVPQCLRHGVSPVLNHDWTDHSPPEAGAETDWFSVQTLYAIVASSAAEMLYTQRALRQSLVEREQKLKTAFELLEGWRQHLPASLRDINKQNTHLILDEPHTRDITLQTFRQYHEAVFMICFPWACNRSDSSISEDSREKSVELCVNSAQVVLTIANQILNLDILDGKFLHLISAAICIIFLDIATRSSTEESISYLSMGCGVFGRLTVLDNEVPFTDVLELARTAQQITGK